MATFNQFDRLYAELENLDRVDPLMGAIYREQAQAILANPAIALTIRKAIADLLMQANQRLAMSATTGSENSY
ncbi:MAG: hypothetical protein HC820_02475 [Hydrococcus sp. RM1_1_31]|nr:hypothetical protein [Hydrococcus sp. RM1_1_31]